MGKTALESGVSVDEAKEQLMSLQRSRALCGWALSSANKTLTSLTSLAFLMVEACPRLSISHASGQAARFQSLCKPQERGFVWSLTRSPK